MLLQQQTQLIKTLLDIDNRQFYDNCLVSGCLHCRDDLAHLGLRVGGKARYNGGFPMNSGVYVGDVDSYTVLDLQARYELPFDGLYLLVNVDNFLDSGYQAFVGAPEVGRLAYAQVGINF